MIASLFAHRAASDRELLRQSCESLLGLCNGLLSDGDLGDKEILFLKRWIEDNDDLACSWPGDLILSRVNAALADRTIDEPERRHLITTLQALIDDTLAESPSYEATLESLAEEQITDVDFSGKSFCFIGEFVFGSGAACGSAVEALGATAQLVISDTLDYLVIGTLINRGRDESDNNSKIDEAVRARDTGSGLRIISEETWVRFLPES